MSSAVSATPKDIIARDQVRLGFGRCFELALSGMSYRMFRSSVTIAILALAVAFIAHMASFGLLADATEAAAQRELLETRRIGQEITRLTTPDNARTVVTALVRAEAGRLAEYREWSGLSSEELARARRIAETMISAEKYFAGLPPSARAVLVGDQSMDELFERLGAEGELARFTRRLAELGLQAPLGDAGSFERLVLVDRPQLERLARAVEQGQQKAIARVGRAHPGRPTREVLLNQPPDFARELRQAGYRVDVARLGEWSRFAWRAEDLRVLAQSLLQGEAAAQVARETRAELARVNLELVADYVDGPARARWLAGVLQSAGAPARLGAERLSELVQSHRRERQLSRAVGDETREETHGVLGVSGRTQWLIVLSFLVCVVGVANAMLMSVTERFTEIATMKCLGAMDRFVMAMFVLEAIIQGAVGGLFGLVLGALLALLRAAFDYGSLLEGARDAAGSVGLALLGAWLVGVLLAAIAAVGPSWVASRLAPMEAMRVE